MGKKETAWERIEGASPLSLVIGRDTDDDRFVGGLLDELAPELEGAGIIPVRFSCPGDMDIMSFWKSLFERIMTDCRDCFDEYDKVAVEEQVEDYRNALEEGQVYLCITSILDILKESGRKILLIVEDFERFFDRYGLSDINVFHSFTGHVALVTVSSENLDSLGKRRYGSAYFCNQFVTVDYS